MTSRSTQTTTRTTAKQHAAPAEPRRQRILQAALILFAERGFAGASVRDIARSAGVSPALLWRHFENKDKLMAAVDDHVEREVVENLAQFDLETQQSWARSYLSPASLHYLKRGLVEPTQNSLQLWQKIYQISLEYNREATRRGQFRDDVDLHQLTMHVLMNVMLTPLFEPLLESLNPDITGKRDRSDRNKYEQQVAFEFALWDGGIRPRPK